MAADSQDSTSKPKLKIRDGESTRSSKKSGERRKGKGKSRSGFGAETLAQVLIAFLLVGSPWWFGSVGALPQLIAALVLLTCLLIWFVKSFSNREYYRPHIITFLFFFFLILGLVQQISLPGFASSRLSTKQNEIRGSLAEKLEAQHPDLAKELKSQSQVAINRPAANYQYSYFCLTTAAFLLGGRFFYRRRDLLALATAVAFNGAAIAVFGAFQKVGSPDRIYGKALEFGGVPFGPFVNRNNASGYLLMCLACCLGALLYSFSTIRNRQMEHSSGFSREGFWSNVFLELRTMVAGLDVKRIGLLAVGGSVVLGIGLSLSRGGILALGVGFLFFMMYLLRMKSSRGTLLVTLFLVPVIAAMLVGSGMQKTIGERLESLKSDDLLDKELRIVLWRDSLRAVPDYPILGSGVGSYPYIYKEYQTFPDLKWCFHAENIFVETLVTFGVLGGIVLLGGLIAGVMFCFSLPLAGLDGENPSSKSVAIGGLAFFVLVSQCVSNFFDFGLLIPSNGLLFAVLMGALTGAWCIRIEQDKRKKPRSLSRLPKWTCGLMVPVVAVLIGLAGYCFWQVYATETANRFARSHDVEEWTQENVSDRIELLERVLSGRPNLETHEYLGRLYVLRIQHSLTDLQMTALEGKDVKRKDVWDSNSIRMLNFQLSGLSETDRKSNIDQILADESIKADIQAATREYLNALAACPLSVRSLIGLAELAYLNGENPDSYFDAITDFNIRKPEHLVRIGNVAISHQKTEIAIPAWRRALDLTNEFVDVVMPTALFFLGHEKVAMEVVPDNSTLLNRVAAEYFSAPEQEAIREEIFRRIVQLSEGRDYSTAEEHRSLAKAHLEIGEIVQAIRQFEKASLLMPSDLKLKAELADWYFRVGRHDEAIETIKSCIDSDKNNTEFDELLEKFEN